MKLVSFTPRCVRGCFIITVAGAQAALALVHGANLPVPVPAKTLEPVAQTTPSMPTAVNASSTSTPPTSALVNTNPQLTDAKPRLPLAFADFAKDYHPAELHPDWLTVQIGTIETMFAPPADKPIFVLPQLKPELAVLFQPQEMSALVGAKSLFQNVMQFDVDPLGHPLGYTLPMGRLIYFLAREDRPEGISFSLHYYDSSQLRWVASGEKQGWRVPSMQATVITQDLVAPAESYVFIYLSNRVGQPRAGSTARPLSLYTYLVLRMHREEPAEPATATGLVNPSGATTR